ncbi:hypothetical protein [Microcystis sp. M42BS1]|uniref:hypothetical protein n=1 Tax=Microcystis sp. M42BS1 TaxID=2771192 RepID=UPI002590ACDE|nr:hypothetical protein [Microcystis sp. M42BS1]MCA2570679.1 hypothetical protein [Microcystis sp. M42BS1]
MENSIEDYNRKFAGTYAYAKLVDGHRWIYVNEVTSMIADTVEVYGIDIKDSVGHSVESSKFVCSLQYKIPERRYYATKKGHGVFSRRFERGYQVGIADHWNFMGDRASHYIHKILWNVVPKPDPVTAIEEEGLLSPKILLTQDAVEYLGIRVGHRKGNKFLVEDWILQEIKDAAPNCDII